jgi:hypothetical protein
MREPGSTPKIKELIKVFEFDWGLGSINKSSVEFLNQGCNNIRDA